MLIPIQELRLYPTLKADLYISAGGSITYWPLLKAQYKFTDAQKRPYNFNPAPFLLADYDYTAYPTTIETKNELVQKNPDLVKRFVDASIKGWYSYLQNPEPGNKLIKKDNPEMTDEQIKYGLQKLKEYGVIVSGDAEKLGIGAMTAERWQSFFDKMVKAGVFKPNTNYKEAFTLQFVNKNVQAFL